MADLISPISTGTINGQPLRFFRSPRTAGPDMPWHAADDLYHCLALPRDVRRTLQQMVRRDFGADAVMVATPTGIVTLAPHYAAQGLIAAALQLGGIADPSIEHQHVKAGAEAMKALTGDLPAIAAVEFAIAAFKNSGGGANG